MEEVQPPLGKNSLGERRHQSRTTQQASAPPHARSARGKGAMHDRAVPHPFRWGQTAATAANSYALRLAGSLSATSKN